MDFRISIETIYQVDQFVLNEIGGQVMNVCVDAGALTGAFFSRDVNCGGRIVADEDRCQARYYLTILNQSFDLTSHLHADIASDRGAVPDLSRSDLAWRRFADRTELAVELSRRRLFCLHMPEPVFPGRVELPAQAPLARDRGPS